MGSTIGGSLQVASQTVLGGIAINTGSLTVGGQTLVLGGSLAVQSGGTLTSQNVAVVSQFGTAQAPQAVLEGRDLAGQGGARAGIGLPAGGLGRDDLGQQGLFLLSSGGGQGAVGTAGGIRTGRAQGPDRRHPG